ncbi:hypothetical protein [Mycoplasma phocoenae]|uniref:Uncharacterized protein n=1 Tax=Mycoplasma phocoenae TaxID=754517 RepID=A0A858U7B4_9MOLU|nr:hypothetical protein [Mycoplasma phocoenae]QJG67155.1 hypothetical protein HGG69_02450 [Mycoplasma phocoenae]
MHDKTKEINNKIRKLHLSLLANKNLLKYNSRFKDKQVRFLISKILILFDTNYSIEQLVELEISLMQSAFVSSMYVDKLLLSVDSLCKKYQSCNWKALGKFLYLIFKTSTYYFDKKHKVPNIFIIHGEIEINEKKREALNDFAISLEAVETDFNFYIRKILKWVK